MTTFGVLLRVLKDQCDIAGTDDSEMKLKGKTIDIIILSQGDETIAFFNHISGLGVEDHRSRVFLTATMMSPYCLRISDDASDLPMMAEPSVIGNSSMRSARLCRPVVISMKSIMAGFSIQFL